MRASRNTEVARGAMGREEQEREFGTLLVDFVRDHEVRPRFVAVFCTTDNENSLDGKVFQSHCRAILVSKHQHSRRPTNADYSNNI